MKYKSTLFLFSLVLVMAGATAQKAQARPGAPLRPWYNYLTKEVWSLDKQAWCRKVSTMQNAQYTLPMAGTIKLIRGEYSNPAERVSARMLDKPGTIALGDLNQDGHQEGVAVIATNTGGTGVFTFLIVSKLQNGQAQQWMIADLGDRVRVESILVRSGAIVVDMIAHGPQDGQCCPSKPVRRTYEFEEGKLYLLSEKPR